MEPEVIQLGDGYVVVRVQTLNSGLMGNGTIHFLLTITRSGDLQIVHSNLRIMDSDYKNGDLLEYNAIKLVVGESYIFTAQAGNQYGVSGVKKSQSISIMREPLSRGKSMVNSFVML